ncbi:hypothetical protein DFH06DRAFT_1293932 [Mycena polygramma]|nr:hypothetical protein DFH06DRAFT_1293932 [Mycena polygramma]
MEATIPPVLPAELERLIFEVAALSSTLMATFHPETWVEPLLYRILVVHDARPDFRDNSNKFAHPLAIKASVLLSLIHSKPPTFFKDYVRHLFLGGTLLPTGEADILSACSNVEDLWWIAASAGTVPQIHMPLKRLHCTFNTMFSSPEVPFTQLFASMTHLEIFDLPGSQEVHQTLTHLPQLTHLAFNYPDCLPLFLSLLRKCTSLQVLVLLLGTGLVMVRVKEYCTLELAQDVRFVTMIHDYATALEDWIMAAHTGVDYWSRAEEFIAKRKSGEVNPLHYFLDGEYATEMDGAEPE